MDHDRPRHLSPEPGTRRPISGAGQRVEDHDVAPVALWQSPPLQALRRFTIALRATPEPANLGSVMRAAIGALSAEPGQRCLIWLISPDGTRMRLAAATAEGTEPWQPATGPVAEVLGARRSIEMGIVDQEMVRIVSDAPVGRVEAGDDESRPSRAFGRFVPIHAGGQSARPHSAPRIAAVLAMVRSAGRPVFDLDDRDAYDSVSERIEAAFAQQRADDALAGERARGLVHGQGQGVMMGDDLLARLGAIGGDIVFRHLFGSGTDYVSGGVLTSLGYTPAEIMSDPGLINRLVHPDDRHVLGDLIEDPALAAKPLQLRMLRRNGNVSWQLVRVLPILDGAGRVLGLEGLATDVTAMKQAEAALAHQARSDVLTGLANRLNFREATVRALARIERHAGMMGVLFLDLDGFKAVNDTRGHAAGDQVLVQVADRLRRLIRREDLVARLGGDEFAVLLAELRDIGEATATARRILDALEVPLDAAGAEANISTGIGIAVTRSGAVTPDELINRADIALYQAKRVGRGRWQVYEGPNGSADTSQAALIGDADPVGAQSSASAIVTTARPTVTAGIVRAALAAGEFRVRYLPEVDSLTGRVIGVEALVRWQHPELGLLPAALFIDEVDDTEATHVLSHWVIREAARQVSLWRSDFYTTMALWVNVSGTQLVHPGFAQSLLTTLASVGLAPRDVGIDVSEAVLSALDPLGETVVSALHRAGVRIAIGDFGIGASSLRTLRKLPLSQIKLDRSLTAEIDGTDDGELVALAIKLASSLGAEVVAVGVERATQLERLRVLQCAYFQGFLAGEARTAAEITLLLEGGQLILPLGD